MDYINLAIHHGGKFVEGPPRDVMNTSSLGTQQTRKGKSIDNVVDHNVYINPFHDVEYESEELHTPVGSEDEEEDCVGEKWPEFNTNVGYGNVRFELGMIFPNLEVFKEAVKDYAVYEGKQLIFSKNDNSRCRVTCQGDCPWALLCSWAIDLQSYQIKTFIDTHSYSRVLKVQQATSEWLGKKFVSYIRTNPHVQGIDGLDLALSELLPGHEPVLPPVLKRPPGRPKKQRKKEQSELPDPYKLKRRHSDITCQKCGLTGHNKRTCKGPPTNKPNLTNRGPHPKKKKTSKGNKEKQSSIDIIPPQESTRSIATSFTNPDVGI
ncbi:Transposase, MuDR, plant [Sesbania bispinosa]|nr:Transposase, MuDR, plant [Sesbania bispinosa]